MAMTKAQIMVHGHDHDHESDHDHGSDHEKENYRVQDMTFRPAWNSY